MRQINALKQRINLPLLLIVILAALLRLSFLADIPNGLQQDEAAAGYDAYSILKTLRTQYGQFLPLFSQTYNGPIIDFDESNYRFLIVPFIGLFGLNEFTTRLPAALVGTLNVLTLYLLAKELFNQRTALISALFLAISPWHILISRIAFRTVLFPCLFCFALFLFLKGLKDRKYLIFSGLGFGICLYTYTSARVFVPFFLIGIVWIFRKELWRSKAQTLVAASSFLIILIFLFSYWASPALMARADASVCIPCLLKKPLSYLSYYLSYFNPGFLFFGHPSTRNTAGHIGFLLLSDFITVIAGLFFILKLKDQKRSLLLVWLLLYPIPAALVIGAYDLRAAIGIPLFCLLSAHGFVQLENSIDRSFKKYFYPASILLLVISFLIFFNAYFIGFYNNPPGTFHYGVKEAILYAERSSYDCVVMTDRIRRLNTMIIFYTQYPPDRYQLSPIEAYTETDYIVGKYHVVSIAKAQKFDEQCLYVIRPKERRNLIKRGYQLRPIHTVKDPQGKEAVIELVEVRKSAT